jgi:hypothetical protein
MPAIAGEQRKPTACKQPDTDKALPGTPAIVQRFVSEPVADAEFSVDLQGAPWALTTSAQSALRPIVRPRVPHAEG